MSGLYTTLLLQPIFNLLIGLYNLIPGHSMGLAIIVLTVLVKMILWPITAKSLKSQRALQEIQPKLEELKRKYPNKEDKEKLAKEMMELYSKEKVNPLSSCLPLLIQLPVFIALYHSLRSGLESSGFDLLYSFVSNPGSINTVMFGVIDLADRNVLLAVLAAITQFFQAKMMIARQQPKKTPGAKDEAMLANMNRSMIYFMPIVTLVIGLQFPGGLTLYWLVMNLLTILQQKLAFSSKKKEGTKSKTEVLPEGTKPTKE